MPLLLAHFLRRFCPGRVPPGIGPRAWEALLGYDFPGNVRELAHAVERAVVLARGGEIDVEHLPEDIVGLPLSDDGTRLEPLAVAAKQFEKQHIVRALALCADDHERASELLGVAVKTLKQKIERHGIGADNGTSRTSGVVPKSPRVG
jgi:DNA-binding NtrC family response regulator